MNDLTGFASRGRDRALRLAWQVPIVIITWLDLIQWPIPPTAGLDPSWQLVLSDAWTQRRQFGTDLIFTFGPWGFLFQQYVLPENIALKVGFELAAKLLLAIGLIGASRRLGLAWRAALIVAVWLLGPVFLDPLLAFIVAALVVMWLLAPSARAWQIGAGVVVLAFLSLVKLTNLLLAGFGVALASVMFLATGRWRRAAATSAGFTAALLGWWALAGQAPGNLIAFIVGAMEMSGGYAQAMAFDESWATFTTGVALLSALTVWLLLWAWSRRDSVESLAVAAVLEAALCLAWKHGFTRADNHVLLFFNFALYLAIALTAMSSRAIARAVLVAVSLTAGAGFWPVHPDIIAKGPGWAEQRVVDSFRRLSGSSWRSDLAAQSAGLARTWQFPRTAAAVGDRTIDLLDFDQGIVLLNHLTYQPRPVPQSYAAYTPSLLAANLAFIESDRAPEYLLAGAVAIDGRALAQNDALMLAELPRRYEPVLHERGYTLLKRRSAQPPPRSQVLTPLLDVVASPGQAIELPDETSHALWLQVQAHRSWLGHLRSLVYKPAMLVLIAENESQSGRFLLVPGIAEAGFVLQPFLADESDLGPFLRGEGFRRARRIRIQAVEGQERFWRSLDVRVSRMESMPLRFLREQ